MFSHGTADPQGAEENTERRNVGIEICLSQAEEEMQLSTVTANTATLQAHRQGRVAAKDQN